VLHLKSAVTALPDAPRTAELLDDLGFTPVVADISEFEKLEGCVTCLSELLPGQ
jgi:dimethylargininase